MVSFFYPENGERFPGSPDFDYSSQAISFFECKRPNWVRTRSHEDDYAAFMNPLTGDIVVVRDVEPE